MDGSTSSIVAVRHTTVAKAATPGRTVLTPVPSEPQQLSPGVLRSMSQWLLDRERRPAFIVDGTAAVVLMNRAARQALQCPRAVEIAHGKLRMLDRRNQAAFARTLGELRPQGGRVIHPAGKGVAMHVLPIEVDGYPERLLLCRLEGQYGDLSNCDQVRRVFRLTLAEAQVALAIFDGKSLVDTARIRRTSINTVKAQSQRIFEKCGVHSQVDLARRLAGILRDADT